MSKLTAIRGLLLAGALILSSLATAQVRISEIHYDNAGIDAGEAIEISAPAGTDLTGWSVVLYNGNDGAIYDTDALSGDRPRDLRHARRGGAELTRPMASRTAIPMASRWSTMARWSNSSPTRATFDGDRWPGRPGLPPSTSARCKTAAGRRVNPCSAMRKAPGRWRRHLRRLQRRWRRSRPRRKWPASPCSPTAPRSSSVDRATLNRHGFRRGQRAHRRRHLHLDQWRQHGRHRQSQRHVTGVSPGVRTISATAGNGVGDSAHGARQ